MEIRYHTHRLCGSSSLEYCSSVTLIYSKPRELLRYQPAEQKKTSLDVNHSWPMCTLSLMHLNSKVIGLFPLESD